MIINIFFNGSKYHIHRPPYASFHQSAVDNGVGGGKLPLIRGTMGGPNKYALLTKPNSKSIATVRVSSACGECL